MAKSPIALLYDHVNSRFLKYIQDGTDSLLGVAAKLRNAAGTTIDPATETTLAVIQTVIEAIRDTAGIKKIVDALPAGDNNIGNVDAIQSGTWTVQQGTPPWAVKGTDADGSAPTQSPILTAGQDGTNVQTLKTNTAGRLEDVLYDSSGNAIGVVLDDSVYRLQTDSKVAKGDSALVHLDAIDTATGHGRLKATLYTPDGDPVAFGAISSSLKNDYAMYSSSPDLLVDGSVTPVVFTYLADSTYNISLQEIRFTLVANGITFGNGYFGATAGPLTNGVLVQVISGGNTTTIFNIKTNEHFINFASPAGWEWIVSNKDVMTSAYLIGGGVKLIAGSGDQVKITVRDDITAAGLYFECFIKGNLLMEA